MSKRVTIRLEAAEYERLKIAAADSGLPISTYLRVRLEHVHTLDTIAAFLTELSRTMHAVSVETLRRTTLAASMVGDLAKAGGVSSDALSGHQAKANESVRRFLEQLEAESEEEE